MKRLVLIRHGQSEWNAQHRIQGHAGGGLTDRGRQQSDGTARWVASTHPQARVVASDLQRCQETVTPIAAALGVDVAADPRLRERTYGSWEGLTLDELARDDPPRWDRWRGGEDLMREVGGESGEDLLARVEPALREHVDATDDDATVVVITHGGPIWHGLHALLDLPDGTLGGVGNAAVTEVVHDHTGWWCESWNQTSHLPTELRTSFRPAEMRAGASKD